MQRREILHFTSAVKGCWHGQQNCEKTSGTEQFYSLFLLNFDQFYWITFKSIIASTSHCDDMNTWHVSGWHDRSGQVRMTWVLREWKLLPCKNFLIRSLCFCAIYLMRMLCVTVDIKPCIGKCSKTENSRKNLNTFHCRERQSVHWAAYFLQEVLTTDQKFQNNCQRSHQFKVRILQKETFPLEERSNKQLKCCSSSSGAPVSGALCSSTQSRGINWNNNDFPNPFGKTAKTSLLQIKFAIPSFCSALGLVACLRFVAFQLIFVDHSHG